MAARFERKHERAAAAIPAEEGDLSCYSQSDLDEIALRLNQRPRKTLGFETPADKLQASVASTPETTGIITTYLVLRLLVRRGFLNIYSSKSITVQSQGRRASLVDAVGDPP